MELYNDDVIGELKKANLPENGKIDLMGWENR